jgi:hypothetical protein
MNKGARRFKVTRRLAAVVTVLVGSCLVWIAYEVTLGNRRLAAIKAIERGGGTVLLESVAQKMPRNPTAAIRRVLGTERVFQARAIYLGDSRQNRLLREIQQLQSPEMKRFISGPSGDEKASERQDSFDIGDEILRHIGVFPEIESLELRGRLVADQGLTSLRRLRRLRELDMAGTKIGDDALVHLSHLEHLESLSLSGTIVSGDGLVHLKELRSLRSLTLGATSEGRAEFEASAVGDEGLEHLRSLTIWRNCN